MILSLEDLRYITAARRCMESGDCAAAFAELEGIDGVHRAHPEVMKLRWQIYNSAGKHGSAFVVAEGLTRLLPREPEPYVWRAHSARHMEGGSIERAFSMLLDVAYEFPNDPGIPFALACYNCQLGSIEPARNWLHIAFEAAEKQCMAKEWKLKALNDQDLELLWVEIRGCVR